MKEIHSTVESYIDAQAPDRREGLLRIREIIITALPGAEEAISYGMPCFKMDGVVCWYAPFKNHYGLLVRPAVKQAFARELEHFKGTKSSIHLPVGTDIPGDLIAAIVRHSAEMNRLNKAAKKKPKSATPPESKD